MHELCSCAHGPVFHVLMGQLGNQLGYSKFVRVMTKFIPVGSERSSIGRYGKHVVNVVAMDAVEKKTL